MKRMIMLTAALTLAAISAPTPAQAADKTVRITSSSGAVHSVLSWDDSVDTLCLTLRSTAAGAVSNADMRLAAGGSERHLSVSRADPRDCTGNLSIAEDRLAEMRIFGGTDRWWKSSGWVNFYT